jgi:hypothetical protein
MEISDKLLSTYHQGQRPVSQTNKVPAALLWGSLRNINIFLSIFIASQPITEYHRKNIIHMTKNISLYSNYRYRNHFHRDSNREQIFCGCGLCFCNLFVETSVLGAVLLSCLVSELHKPFHRVSNPRQILQHGKFFKIMASVPVISS